MACFIRDSIFVDVLVDASRVATIAGAPTMTVDDNLRGELNDGEGSVTHDGDTVTEGRSGSHGPAGAAVYYGER